MSAPAVALAAEMPMAEVREVIRQYGFAAFPVVDAAGTTVGVLPGTRTPIAPATTTAGDLADREPALRLGPDDPAADLLERPAFLRVGRAVVVDAENRPLGVVSVTDMERRLRGQRTAGARSQPAGATR